MRLLATGKHGQVVSALQALRDDVVYLGRPECDLAYPETLKDAVRAARPDVLLSLAAYTAVDKAEDEPELAHVINGVAPGVLAQVAADLGIPILHLSTDYVFDGKKDDPYAEEDAPAPVSVYGRTKLEGERAIVAAAANHVILRTAWVYSAHGTNFVRTMLRLGETRDAVNVVNDQAGCPTSADDIVRALLAIAGRVVTDPSPALRGVFHLSAPDATTWAGFAQAIFDGAAARGRKPVQVNPIPSSEYPTRAVRPANSRLSGDKLEQVYGIRLPSWRASLEPVLDTLIPPANLTTL